MPDYDVAIVGAGPGGYVAAIRAAQLGLTPVLVERAELGGVCLNWGCIPSKALLYNAEVVSLLGRAEEFGVSFDNLRVDYSKAIDRSRQIVERLTRGISSLLKKNKVDTIRGEVVLKDAQTLEINDLGQQITASNVILATGARPRDLAILQPDGNQVLTSREAIELRQLPSSIVIVGGGAVGCEFAYLYNTYGTTVTIVEALPHLLPNEDTEISQLLERSFAKQGIQVLTGTMVNEAKLDKRKVTLNVAPKGETGQE